MGSLSPMLIAGTCVIALGELLHIVGLATPNWMEPEEGDASRGLFAACVASSCSSFTSVSSEYEATQAMVIIGMLCGLAAVALAILLVVFTITGKTANQMFPLICFGCSIGAFVFIIIGVIIYGAKIYGDTKGYNLAYSFALCIVGGILLPAGGAIVHFKGGDNNN